MAEPTNKFLEMLLKAAPLMGAAATKRPDVVRNVIGIQREARNRRDLIARQKQQREDREKQAQSKEKPKLLTLYKTQPNGDVLEQKDVPAIAVQSMVKQGWVTYKTTKAKTEKVDTVDTDFLFDTGTGEVLELPTKEAERLKITSPDKYQTFAERTKVETDTTGKDKKAETKANVTKINNLKKRFDTIVKSANNAFLAQDQFVPDRNRARIAKIRMNRAKPIAELILKLGADPSSIGLQSANIDTDPLFNIFDPETKEPPPEESKGIFDTIKDKFTGGKVVEEPTKETTYKTKEDVRNAFKKGDLTKEEAVKILEEQFDI